MVETSALKAELLRALCTFKYLRDNTPRHSWRYRSLTFRLELYAAIAQAAPHDRTTYLSELESAELDLRYFSRNTRPWEWQSWLARRQASSIARVLTLAHKVTES